MDSSRKVVQSVEIGRRYFVKWRTGEKYAAEIIQERPAKKNNVNDAATNLPNEYYVHYTGFDRRLDEWVTIDRITYSQPLSEESNRGSTIARKSKRKFEEITEAFREGNEILANTIEKEYEEITKVKNIRSIEIGKYEIDTWYFSPYPDEYCSEEKLYICEFCLKYMKKKRTIDRHKEQCEMRSPPGKMIYSKDNLAMFEVDGKDYKIYCQNLCLLSKLFLDHKTLYYDVNPFLFYVLCEVDDLGAHIVGYFSKEKVSLENYNLACILTFPPYQRKGYGKFLISVSYELTKRENTTGSPEKPLSDLGKISYRSYWAFAILKFLNTDKAYENVTMQDIGRATGIRVDDILSTLHSLNLIKYWKGQHIISITQKLIDAYLESAAKIRLCDPDFLHWKPAEKAAEKSSSS